MSELAAANLQIAEEVLLNRRSCRKFVSGARIPEEDILRLVAAGVHAPCGSNSQNVRFLAITDAEEIARLGALKTPKALMRSAAAWIVVFTDQHVHKGYPESEHVIWSKLWTQNAAAAVQNILLLATAMGHGSCWISFVPEMNKTRLTSGVDIHTELFKDYVVPAHYAVRGLVLLGVPQTRDALGYPAGDEIHGGKPVKRQPIEAYTIKKRGAQ